jgi:hypothetical protein
MKEIRAFAAVLQALESSSKASTRLCTAEVRGSNPLGSTLEIRGFAGKKLEARRVPSAILGPSYVHAGSTARSEAPEG